MSLRPTGEGGETTKKRRRMPSTRAGRTSAMSGQPKRRRSDSGKRMTSTISRGGDKPVKSANDFKMSPGAYEPLERTIERMLDATTIAPPRRRLSPSMIANYQPEGPDNPEVFAELLAAIRGERDPMGSLGGDFSLTPRTSPNFIDQRGQEEWRKWMFPWMLERGEM